MYAERILAAPPRLGRTRLVAVDGPSGAGKTTFAAELADELPGTPVVHLDDLLDGWDDQLTFWPRVERWILRPIEHGEPGRYRVYDWHRKRFGEEWHTVPAAPTVIIEGFSAARKEVRPRLSFSFFVDAPEEIRRKRVTVRDGPALTRYLRKWWTIEERHFVADATAHNVELQIGRGHD